MAVIKLDATFNVPVVMRYDLMITTEKVQLMKLLDNFYAYDVRLSKN